MSPLLKRTITATTMKSTIYTKPLMLCGLLLMAITAAAQSMAPTPAPPQDRPILLTGATIHQGNGKEIQEGAVGFKDGLIDYVGSAAAAPRADYQEVIDISGEHLYPGFIAVNSTIGLVEIGAVRASRDEREVGYFNPHVRALSAYNTESMITPTVRANGVLMAQITPRGGRISGQSSLVHFDAWGWDDAVVAEDEGLHLYWPRTMSWSWEKRKMTTNEHYAEQVQEIKDFLAAAKAYCQGDRRPVDLRREAACAVVTGQQTLYVHTDMAKEMEAAVTMCSDMGIDRLCIVGGSEAPLIIGTLKDNKVSILLRRVHSRPMREDDDIDAPYRLAKVLSDAGILFALDNSGEMEQMGTRNLPFYVGTTIAYGLDPKLALQTVTLSPAKILGVDDRLGSIEVGKEATLFVSEGDAFDMRSNQLSRAYISGREIDLMDHQKQKAAKFRKKYQNAAR